MRSVAVVSANFGGHDVPTIPVKQTVQADWIMVTDGNSSRTPAPWGEFRYVQASSLHPRVASRMSKILPDRILPNIETYDWVIWLDANAIVDSPRFVEQVLEFAEEEALTTFRHPRRLSVRAEALSMASYKSVDADALAQQMLSYRKLGLLDAPGMYASAALVYCPVNPNVKELRVEWMEHIHKWTHRDQLSLPIAAALTGTLVRTFPHCVYRLTPTGRLTCYLNQLPVAYQTMALLRRRTRASSKYRLDVSSGGLVDIPPFQGLRRLGENNPWFDLTPHVGLRST